MRREREVICRMARGAILCLGLVMGAGVGSSSAASPGYLNVDVAITASLSVRVNAAVSSTQTVVWNVAVPNDRLVSPSSATVLNDAGGSTEKWALSTNASSINTAGNAGTWSLGLSTAILPGADQFALQAVFGSSRTAAGGCPGPSS